ncbi:MAG: phosphatase PAP2 family protein [Lachnospiraceae bacterium]
MEWLQSLDGNILLFIQDYIRIDGMNGVWKIITSLANSGWFWIALSTVLLVPKKTRAAGFLALLSLGIGFLITNVWLKNMVARPRPYVEIDALTILIRAPHDFSFPSGHTCSSFAAAGVYYKMLPKKFGVAALVLAGLIGFSRLYLGVHYPTDVLGGLMIGLASSFFMCWMYRKCTKPQKLDTTV